MGRVGEEKRGGPALFARHALSEQRTSASRPGAADLGSG